MFSNYSVLPGTKEAKLGSSVQETSPSAGKNTGVVSRPSSAGNVSPQLFLVIYFCGSLGVACEDR